MAVVYAPGSNPFSAGGDFPSTATGVTLPGGVDAVFCDYPYTVSVEVPANIVTSWDGHEKRSAKGVARKRFVLKFEHLDPDDANAVWNHFLAQSGPLEDFSYFDYVSEEEFTVRYDMDEMSRETFLFEVERAGVRMIEVLA